MDNGAIGFFLFFVILIIIWIFAMGGCVRERNSLEGYEGYKKYTKTYCKHHPYTSEGTIQNNVNKLQCPPNGVEPVSEIVGCKNGRPISATKNCPSD